MGPPLKRFASLLIALALLVAGRTPGDPSRAIAQQRERDAPRANSAVTILQINDVYSMLPVDGTGGLARVATLKQKVAAAGDSPLLVLAGDFLAPSVASSVFKGEQMIAALNAAGLDLATLGNHEFDFGADVLIQRMHEARWQWVVSNVLDTRTGKPVGGAAPWIVRRFGSLTVGFIGLCLTDDGFGREKLGPLRLEDPLRAAARILPEVRQHGAAAIVAITHLPLARDRALAARFPQIDLIVGGHEHVPITASEEHALISKAGSDARYVARIDLVSQPGGRTQRRGRVERVFELVPITNALPDDPTTAAVVDTYEKRLGAELDLPVGATRVPLDGESARLRVSETNLGDLVADAIRADTSADVAIVNAGSIRGDRVYPAGALTRRTLIAIQPFGNIVCQVAVPGRILAAALAHGVSRLPAAAGQFPQVSGVTFRVDPMASDATRVRDIRVNGQPLDRDRVYTIALNEYMLKGGDGYTMFAGQKVLVGPEAGGLTVAALERYVTTRGDIAPEIDGRVLVGR